ncbi:MAG: class II fumarate hydratase [Firmicutes bacterium]|nr:class II fumarate hydratase [Bacillota bacterium]
MGEIRVPIHSHWGAQTERAVQNFPISGQRVNLEIVYALSLIKAYAAETNANLGIVEPDVAGMVTQVAFDIADGKYDNDFPIDVFQTGSGTSTNMNVNEVIAHIASERLNKKVKPNDAVNASQSSNDTFPTAIHLATAINIQSRLLPALVHLQSIFEEKASEFVSVVKTGRTHLMDATPVTLGQEFGGYSAQIAYAAERIAAVMPRLCELPLGGTAVGTGLNAPKGFAASVIALLKGKTGLPLSEARNHFEAQGSRDALVETSGVLRTIAVSLYKIANDLRWMSSGPKCGLGEIHLPDLQPGSSIMPGKVNPVVPEAVAQVAAQVIGNDAAVAFGGSAGNFELNVMLPVIGRNILESVALLASVSTALADKCVKGIQADEKKCLTYALSSPSIVTSLNPYLGYETAAKVVKESLATDKDIKTVILEKGLLDEATLAKALDVLEMTKGGII